MQLVYTPEGAEPKRWDINLGRMPIGEVEFIEDKTGMSHVEWQNKLGPWMKANRALLFVLMKREHPTLKWDELQPFPDEIAFTLSDAEEATMLASLRAKDKLTDGEADLLAALEADAPEEEPAATDDGEPDPKD